nr:MAG TPA: distal tail protein [Caudoviricetes sp.]
MATIKDKIHFTYNGKSTKDFEMMNVSMNGGMFEETFVAGRAVNDELMAGSKRTIFNGVTKEQVTFELTIAFEKYFTEETIENVIDWLYGREYYSKLQFEDNEKFVYAIPDGESTITHTGFNEGYITVSMKTNSPYMYKDIITKTGTGATVELDFESIGKTNPLMNIDVKKETAGSGTSQDKDTIKITKDGYTLQINNVALGETITIDPYEEDIKSSVDNVYHYKDVVGDMSKVGMTSKTNQYTITSLSGGDITATITYQPYFDK